MESEERANESSCIGTIPNRPEPYRTEMRWGPLRRPSPPPSSVPAAASSTTSTRPLCAAQPPSATRVCALLYPPLLSSVPHWLWLSASPWRR